MSPNDDGERDLRSIMVIQLLKLWDPLEFS